AGISVRVKGTNRGTSTNQEGNFSLQASVGDVLVFSGLGYTEKEQIVGSETTLQVLMEEHVQEIDEVVVIGYGTVRKSDLTGSVAQVKAKEVNAFPNANVLQALSGRAP